jgi:hypothetical protein
MAANPTAVTPSEQLGSGRVGGRRTSNSPRARVGRETDESAVGTCLVTVYPLEPLLGYRDLHEPGRTIVADLHPMSLPSSGFLSTRLVGRPPGRAVNIGMCTCGWPLRRERGARAGRRRERRGQRGRQVEAEPGGAGAGAGAGRRLREREEPTERGLPWDRVGTGTTRASGCQGHNRLRRDASLPRSAWRKSSRRTEDPADRL